MRYNIVLLTVTSLLVVCDIDVIKSSSKDFYIMPSSNSSCPQGQSCLTLLQFAAISRRFHGNDTNVTLYFLPGHHYFNQKLLLIGVNNFTMTKDVQHGNDIVLVDCLRQHGKFEISKTMFVLIKDLQFTACGPNTIASVNRFILKDSTFWIRPWADKQLILNGVANASILRSYFIGRGYSTVLYSFKSVVNITNSTYSNYGRASNGAVMDLSSSILIVTNSIFVNNSASNGGVITMSRSSFHVYHSLFVNNTAAAFGGGVLHSSNSSFQIIDCYFHGNYAQFSGGVIDATNSAFIIIDSYFRRSYAQYSGGVVDAKNCTFTITKTIFFNNGGVFGGVIHLESILNHTYAIISDCVFQYNLADAGGIVETTGSNILIENCKFDRNIGSIYTFNSNITFGGQNVIENSIEPHSTKTFYGMFTVKQGGANTSYQSNMYFTGEISLVNNKADQGGAILAVESTISAYGCIAIIDNVAMNNSGGGMYLHTSNVKIFSGIFVNISNNYAEKGGGIHAISSVINVYRPGSLRLINNTADVGGGMCLEVGPRINILLSSYRNTNMSIVFFNNRANYGGAIFVVDNTSSAACSSSVECFFQSLTLGQYSENTQQFKSFSFSDNRASVEGSNLFGGLLDRCVLSPFAEIRTRASVPYNGITYLGNISNIALDSITSLPVRVCFCNSVDHFDCNFEPNPVKVMKGEAFNISLVAVDQASHPVDAAIISTLSSPNGAFGEGQQTQKVNKTCTDLTFNVISRDDHETIKLHADGPCGSSDSSTRHVDVHFLKCFCSLGFVPSDNSSTKCECHCDPRLSPFITTCDYATKTLVRVHTNSWITYINGSTSDVSGFLLYSNCPFDYCHPQSEEINFSLPNEVDAQCLYNRSGILCGSCQENFSLSLGSSRCLECPTYWPAIVAIIVFALIVAGILLVIVLLVLNITVTTGLINGIIFYANVISMSSGIVFPVENLNFPKIIVAWLNLDIGFDVCFFDGLDMYTKTWLQFAFPVYIISLVIIVIKISEYSPRFTRLLNPGKRDPVATLATLTLLSYAKLLSISIAVLSFAILRYPDGSKTTVWLPDGSVQYFRGKHIPLAIVVILIVLVGVPYTLLLFFWQWLMKTSHYNCFSRWTMDTKINAIVTTYHAPYNYEYRFWTGLLLLARVVLYLTAAVTESQSPRVPLLMTLLLVGFLLFLKGAIGVRLYKKTSVDITETVILINLLVYSGFSLYKFKSDNKTQMAIAYSSTAAVLLILIGVVIYHITIIIVRKRKAAQARNEYGRSLLIEPVEDTLLATDSEVTYSTVEVPTDKEKPGLYDSSSNSSDQ